MNRHEKFSSIGIDLTEEVMAGSTFKTERGITSIAVHCSDSPQGRGDDAHTIDRWHLERWGEDSGIGYHYVVLEDGTIQKGRWVDYPGAHVAGWNQRSIGICRIGGKGIDGKPLRDVTFEQLNSLRILTQLLVKLYKLDMSKVLGHDEYPRVNKNCPMMNMNLIRGV